MSTQGTIEGLFPGLKPTELLSVAPGGGWGGGGGGAVDLVSQVIIQSASGL